MTTSETLADEAVQVIQTMIQTVESGHDACPMLVAFREDRRCWTAFLPGTNWEPMTDWLARSGADAAIIAIDAFVKVIRLDQLATGYVRPRDDPGASEALLLSAWMRDGPVVRTCAATRVLYGRDDDGSVHFDEAEVQGEAPMTGPIADAIGVGLVRAPFTWPSTSLVIEDMLAAGCAVMDAKGRLLP